MLVALTMRAEHLSKTLGGALAMLNSTMKRHRNPAPDHHLLGSRSRCASLGRLTDEAITTNVIRVHQLVDGARDHEVTTRSQMPS